MKRGIIWTALTYLMLTPLVLASCSSSTATPTTAVVATIRLLGWPVGVAVNPSTNLIYAVNEESGTVSVINGASNRVVATVSTESMGGTLPFDVAVNPSTNLIYVASTIVSVIYGSTNSIVMTVSVGGKPQGVAVNPSTNMIYVAN